MFFSLLSLVAACGTASESADSFQPSAGQPEPGVVFANVPGADAGAHPVTDPVVRAALGTLAVDDRFALADGVFLGKVVGIEYRMSEGTPAANPLPFTFVTWQVERAWKGTSRGEYVTARLLGGPTPDGRVLAVSEQPTFQDDDRDVIFLDSQSDGASPVLGGEAGRYRILDGGAYTDDGRSIGIDANGELAVVGFRDFPELDVLAMGSAIIERERSEGPGNAGQPGVSESTFAQFLDSRVGVDTRSPHVHNRDAGTPFVFAYGTQRFSR